MEACGSSTNIAWTSFQGRRLQIHAARKHATRTFAAVKGAVGEVSAITDESVFITAQGGQIEATKLRFAGGKKLAAPHAAAEAGLRVGTVLG